MHQRVALIQAKPAADDFNSAPGSTAGLIHVQDDMIVIAHHRIGSHVDGEDFAWQSQPINQPRLAVIEVFVGIPVVATQKGPPRAAGYAVVVKRIVQRDYL